MTRVDLFTTIHKAIRVLLFDAVTRTARTDFLDPAEADATTAAVRAVLGFLGEHAAHEDDVILPALGESSPELLAELRGEHARLAGLEREVERLLDRVDAAGPVERASLGDRLQHRLQRLAAAHLLHLEREETEVNRALWAHRTDAELAGLRARIQARMPNARYAEWLAVALPAMAAAERAAMLRAMKAGMPGAAFAAVTAPARAALGAAAWEAALGGAIA